MVRPRPRWMFALACAALLGDGVAAPTPRPPADVRRDATVAAVERVMPCVVNIATLTVERPDPYEQLLRDFFGYRRRAPDTLYSSGSGVIIDEDGWVITNHHVVRDAARVQVTLGESAEVLEAEIVAVSESDDLALLRIKAESGRRFRRVVMAADDDLLLGETVLALGNPYGLGGSVSRGILSSKTRRPEQDGEPMEPQDWLQTDASINPGNSGGPLINLRGELIGLNVAILANAQGIGFAIPVKRVNAALTRMLSPEHTQGLWFGAAVVGSGTTLRVKEVQPDSPADAAGLKAGDEILSVNDDAVQTIIQFFRELGSGGRAVRLGIRRDGQRRTLQVNLREAASLFTADYARRRLGLTLEAVPSDIQRQLRLDLSSAMLVREVESGSPAARAGIRRGHIITAVAGQPPRDFATLGRLLNRHRAGETLTLDLLIARQRGIVVELSRAQAELRLR